MRKYSLFFVIIILLIILGGCNKLITTDDLIGGKWVAKSGYKDGEAYGKPQCPYLNDGIEFKDEETVYVKSGDKDFRYNLRKSDDGMEITFFNPSGDMDSYEVIMNNENKLVLIGFGTGVSKSFNCYFEREK